MFNKRKKIQKELTDSFQKLGESFANDENITRKEKMDEISKLWKEIDPDGTNELLARFFAMMDGIQERPVKQPLTQQELMELEDMDFYEEIYERVLAKEERDMNNAERLFYLVSLFDMEIQNGGLCQYFANTEPEQIQQLCHALNSLGAVDHKALFESFITDNHIDLRNLKEFHVKSHRGYLKLLKKYPFDAFDDAYMELEPLQDILTTYARTNIDRF